MKGKYDKEYWKESAKQALLMVNNLSGTAAQAYLAKILESTFVEGGENYWWYNLDKTPDTIKYGYSSKEPLDSDCD